jgi:hypothetical protein
MTDRVFHYPCLEHHESRTCVHKQRLGKYLPTLSLQPLTCHSKQARELLYL